MSNIGHATDEQHSISDDMNRTKSNYISNDEIDAVAMKCRMKSGSENSAISSGPLGAERGEHDSVEIEQVCRTYNQRC
jgi:hypothetical protein